MAINFVATRILSKECKIRLKKTKMTLLLVKTPRIIKWLLSMSSEFWTYRCNFLFTVKLVFS